MGLDLLEFTLAIEESFGLYLPEADAVRLVTPGQIIDYLEGRLPPAVSPQCLDQLAFYHIRRASMKVLSSEIEEMPMIAIASLILSTLALT